MLIILMDIQNNHVKEEFFKKVEGYKANGAVLND